MQKEIKHTWYFNRSPQEVWEYLTKSELIEQWLMKNDFLPFAGHKFRFTNPNGTFVYCEVLEVKPVTSLSYSWENHYTKDNQIFSSKVLWILTPIDSGTELLLVHNGFTLLKDFIGHNNGWTALAGRLVELLKATQK